MQSLEQTFPEFELINEPFSAFAQSLPFSERLLLDILMSYYTINFINLKDRLINVKSIQGNLSYRFSVFNYLVSRIYSTKSRPKYKHRHCPSYVVDT